MLHPGKARVLQYTCLLFTCIRSQEKWGQGHTPSLPSLPNLRNVCRSCREECSAVRGSLWGPRPISGRQCLKHKKKKKTPWHGFLAEKDENSSITRPEKMEQQEERGAKTSRLWTAF